MTHDEPLSGDDGWTVVHSNCELVHPRPRMFWVLAYQNVCDMEAQAASLAKERERELRAMNPPGEVQFQRSDDDEIVRFLFFFVGVFCRASLTTFRRSYFPSVGVPADMTGRPPLQSYLEARNHPPTLVPPEAISSDNITCLHPISTLYPCRNFWRLISIPPLIIPLQCNQKP